ncbi:MAG: hypothetical protein HQL67_12790, partial [Magnetococcales bacterium]|nr:hypothetical protein [Magnetococcales bacterium]
TIDGYTTGTVTANDLADSAGTLVSGGVAHAYVGSGTNVTVLDAATIAELTVLNAANGTGALTYSAGGITDAAATLATNSGSYITGSINVNVEDTASIAQLTSISNFTTGTLTYTTAGITDEAATLDTNTGSFVAAGINVTVSNAASIAQLTSIDGTNTTGSVTYTEISDTTANLIADANTYVTGTVIVTFADASSISDAQTIDGYTSGALTLSIIDTGTNIDAGIAAIKTLTATNVDVTTDAAAVSVSEATGLVFTTSSGGSISISDTASNIVSGLAAISTAQITTVDANDNAVSMTVANADTARTAGITFDGSDVITISGSNGSTLAALTFANYDTSSLGGASVTLDASDQAVTLTYSQANAVLTAGSAFAADDALTITGTSSELLGISNVSNLGGTSITYDASDDAALLTTSQLSTLLGAGVAFDGSDVITIQGTGAISAGAIGGSGNYVLLSTGAASLTGGAGDDTLTSALGGTNTMTGGAGADNMSGSNFAGADTFVFNDGDSGVYSAAATSESTALANGIDVIHGFANGTDLIDLSAVTGMSNASAISGSVDGTGVADGEIYLHTVGADTMVLVNSSGGATTALSDFEMAIYVEGGGVDDISDFVIPA